MADVSLNQVTARTPLRLSGLPALPQLYYSHPSGWLPLPRWGEFFLEVGAAVATYPIEPYRFIVGLAIPTKAYAATLTATGIVTSLALTNQFTLDDAIARAGWLRDLAPGTPLLHRRTNNTFQKYTFDRWQDANGIPHVRVKTHQSGTNTLPPKLILGIELLNDPTFTLPRQETRRQMVSKKELAFLSSCLSEGLAGELIAYSRTDCLIIGSKGQLRREARDTRFAVQDTNSRFVEGSLNMLVRMHELLSDSSAHRAVLCSSAGSPADLKPIISPPTAVIFSGATSFLRWRNSWRESHWIVLLDRTEPHFAEAVRELNQEYIRRRAEEEPSELLPALPTGVEAVCYHEAL